MITIRFEKVEGQNKFIRTAVFPNEISFQDELTITDDLYLFQAKYHWEQSTHQLSEKILADKGKRLALAALGEEGVKQFVKLKRAGNWQEITIVERPQTPEIAAIPWELIHIDGEFIALHTRTPVRRMVDGYDGIEELSLNKPLKMALLSATPDGTDRLLIENEQIRFARSIAHVISRKQLVVHEIINCTREKLNAALRHNDYDIVYFTGHGAYLRDRGFLCLENDEGCLDHIDSLEFARLIASRSLPRLAFLNCCLSGASGKATASGAFWDVARKLIAAGVPDVIATQTNVFDNHAQVFMKAFFDEIFSEYNVSNAITRARDALKNALKGDDVSNTFYQYIHLSQTPLNPRVVYKEPATTSPQGKQYFASLNHPSVDMRFVRRYNAITQIESCYREGNKAVMVYGMGGTGKTSLSVMLEQTLLEHYDASLRVKDALWLDLRTSPTVGAMIGQLSHIIADKGNDLNAERMKALEDPLDVPKILNDTFGNEVFLTIDNCETLIDTGTGRIDDKTFAFLINLIAHTTGWKVLLTSREPFPLEFENRTLFNYTKYHLGCLTFTERVALLDVLLHAQRESLEEEVQDTVLREVAGNPYELHLFVKNLSHGQGVDALIKETHTAAGEYAYLDYYLGKVTAGVLSTLHLLAVFQETPTEAEINAVASWLAPVYKI